MKQPPLPGFGDDVYDAEGVAVTPGMSAADDFVREQQEAAGESAEPPPGPPAPVDEGGGEPAAAVPQKARRVPRGE